YNTSTIRISAPYGLRDTDDLQIECITSTGKQADMSIIISDLCGRGYTKCKDGACISVSQLCDGTPHCSDRSDEDNRFCQEPIRPPVPLPQVIVSPPKIDIP
ncbi:unnamed protein product, partial [Hymenolepis diminuta]